MEKILTNSDVLERMNDVLKLSCNSENYSDCTRSTVEQIASNFCCGDRNAERTQGAFKICIILKNSNHVYKIPFDYEPFKNENNACEEELMAYQSAVKAGVEKILLETYFVGFLENGCPIYAQEKADIIVCDMTMVQKRKFERISKTVKCDVTDKVTFGLFSRSVNRMWIKVAISIYGKKFLRKFENWTVEFRLRDLHTGNIGFVGCRPIIVDYNYFG